MTRLRLASVGLVLLALGAAGCGGGGGDDDAPSKAEFAKQAEKICNETKRGLEDVGKGASTPKEIADAVDEVIDKSQKSVDDLKDLDLPEGKARTTAENFVKATETEVEGKGIPALEDLRDALKAGNVEAARKAAKVLQGIESSQSDKYARELGANGCAS
jgi:uncharacterized protein YbjT (DUF2867 family)